MAIIQAGDSANLLSINSQKQALVSMSTRSRSGVYIGSSGLLSVQAAAQAATAGLLWLLNPLGSTKLCAIRRIEVDGMGTSIAAAITRFTAEKITFTGVSSGATVPPTKVDSTQANPSAIITTANTGLTITPVSVMYSYFLMSVITAVGVAEPVISSWDPNEEGMPILRPGEGMVIRQPDAGVATDPRKATVNFAWEEF